MVERKNDVFDIAKVVEAIGAVMDVFWACDLRVGESMFVLKSIGMAYEKEYPDVHKIIEGM